jgi:SAM-dependent methyltransferase
MNIRLIPEDDENDHFILKPLFEAMFRYLGKPHADVKVHHPDVTGWEALKKWEHIGEVLDRFRSVRLFVCCVDRDGHEQRRGILDQLEEKANRILKPTGRLFLAEHAWQEVEVWAMAGIDWRLKPKWTWEAIRDERDSKEHYFEPIVKARGLIDSPGAGRAILGAEAARHYERVRQNCREIRNLEDRIRRWIEATAQR